MVIKHGDVVWADFGFPQGSEPGYERPAIVVQSDLFNETGVSTICVAVITSNLRWAGSIGNVRLGRGEANLEKPSVVNVTLLKSIDRSSIRRKLGTLSKQRLGEVLAGVSLVLGLTERGRPGAS